MQRREFLKTLSAAGTGLLLSSSSLSVSAQQASLPPDPDVKRVLIMFKGYFDAGFIDTQAAVVHKYFSNYFPHAIQIAADQRAQGGHRYVWTTGSWLLYEYLEQASPEDRKRMDEAVGHGDIAWHALPFTWQTELIDPSMITGALA